MSGGDDAFDRAVRALRETGETTSAADVARTKSRILQTMHRGERRGRRTFWVLLPIAAVLAGSTALAKNSEVGRRVWMRVAETIGIEAPAEKTQAAGAPRDLAAHGAPRPLSKDDLRPTDERSAPPEVLGGLPPEVEPLASAAEPAPSLVPSAEVARRTLPVETETPLAALPADRGAAARAVTAPRSAARQNGNGETPRSSARSESASRAAAPRASAPPMNPPPPTPESEASANATNAVHDDGEAATLALYKRAYQLHFVEQNYAAALAGWDAYLRSAPTGRLVVEARYNRAIALVRLGRRSDAEAALGPFARGEVSGGYRAREARELLDALNASSR